LPPGIPPEILKIYRKAAEDMIKDPAFIKTAGPRLEGYEAYVGERAVKLIKNAFDQPESAKKWLKEWMIKDYNLK
jgi:hypothetical protein